MSLFVAGGWLRLEPKPLQSRYLNTGDNAKRPGQAVEDFPELVWVYRSLVEANRLFNHSSPSIKCKLIEEATYTWISTHPLFLRSDAESVGCPFHQHHS